MKKLVTSYVFDASAQTIDSADFTSLEKIQLITNVTDNIIIYNFADPAKGGSLSGTTLTLDYDTTTMDDADKLQIFIEDVSADVLDLTNSNPLAVAIVDDNGDQYAEIPVSIGSAVDIQGTLTAVDTITNVVHVDDNAGSLTVDVGTALPAGNNNIGDVDVVSSALPTGAATSAKQDTSNTSLASIDGKITAVNTGAVVIASGSVTADTELTTADLDTGAGTDTRAVVGIVGSKSGGGVLIPGDATAGLKVDLGADNDITVTSGSITANAGTNLNTSALALESGGNLAGAATSLAVIDDWDESDRAKVNPIVGQAGVQGGSGAVSNTTQRVVLATDVALPAGTNAIGKLATNTGVTIGAVELAASQTLGTLTTLTGGGVAHDAVDSGNPVKVGGRVETATSTATMAADADRSDFITDADGAQVVRLNYPLGDLISERTTDTGGTSTASTNFGATASTRNVITSIALYNSSATAGYIDFRDGTGGSVLWTMALPAGGGSIIGDPSGLFRTTANTALAYDVSAALSTVYISVSGFKSKV